MKFYNFSIQIIRNDDFIDNTVLKHCSIQSMQTWVECVFKLPSVKFVEVYGMDEVSDL